ncbi:MAG: acyl-CoA dehydrogenase family protein [Mycobacteriaceae bacterium]|uniref:acyl-CoA dehydrogenase family protein n=1 Tax=Corynebacterium sp. TaxID=1720 RepID=UPI002651AB1C|nr:acyl-CoA dehydrogenase family protein [Corynebacterium sp.]
MTVTTPLTVAGIRTAIAPVLERLGASARERETTRDFAFAEVRELARAGIGLAGVPAADGGAGGNHRDIADLVIDIARADSNVAQALRPTFLQSRRNPDGPTLQRLRNGDLFAGTVNERSGGANGSVHTTARRVEGGWIIDGRKYYSTGGLYADWFSTAAVTEDGDPVRFTVPTDRAGLGRPDDFDAVGQRLTQSGSTVFDGVFIADSEVNEAPAPENPWTGAFPQLYLAAVQAGIAARALDDAVWFVNERARPIKHSTAATSVEDPYVRETVGEIGIRAQTARAVVLLAAESIDHAPGDEAAVTVAQAGATAIESALKAAELLFDVGGASITDRSLGFDRHWRNARTAANHNPRQWKTAVSGAWHLTGEEPPTSGLF